jgi:thiol:disulfide interchange protein
MTRKFIFKRGISLPFLAVLAVAITLLSGCNLNNPNTASSNSIPPPTPTPNVEAKNEVVNAETASSPNYKAGAIQAFDQAKFDAALADGNTVFLDFYATWCPTCRANEPLVDGAFDGSTDVVGFRVDYDTETELKKQYNVRLQSTYLVVRGTDELARHTGALTASGLDELLGN